MSSLGPVFCWGSGLISLAGIGISLFAKGLGHYTGCLLLWCISSAGSAGSAASLHLGIMASLLVSVGRGQTHWGCSGSWGPSGQWYLGC